MHDLGGEPYGTNPLPQENDCIPHTRHEANQPGLQSCKPATKANCPKQALMPRRLTSTCVAHRAKRSAGKVDAHGPGLQPRKHRGRNGRCNLCWDLWEGKLQVRRPEGGSDRRSKGNHDCHNGPHERLSHRFKLCTTSGMRVPKSQHKSKLTTKPNTDPHRRICCHGKHG